MVDRVKLPQVDVGKTSVSATESRVRLAEVPGAYSLSSTQSTHLLPVEDRCDFFSVQLRTTELNQILGNSTS